jgi:hypothetical protein
MKKSLGTLLLILALIFFNACFNNCQSQQKTEISSSSIDSSLLQFDSITISRNHFSVFYRNNYMMYVINGTDTVNKLACNNGFDFGDFNQDGYKDIIIPYMTNVGGIQDVLLFDPNRKKFILIDNLTNYPAPTLLIKDYYYSYRRAGCADSYWVSNLFKIDDFRAICLGEIWGQGCEPASLRIDIFKVSSDDCKRKTLFKTLPLDTIYKFQDTKWGFIKNFWTKNYSDFL